MTVAAGRCTFTNACGERCGERRFLEIDHIVPRAVGGEPILVNLRLLCRAHNQYEAGRKLGADFMNAKRAQAKANAAAGRKTRATKRETPAPPYERELEPVLVDSPAPPPTAPAPYHRELAEQAVAKPNTPTPFERALVDEAETKPTAMPPFERALADKTVATATVSPKLEHEVVDALTSLGYKPAEARRAVDNIADNTDPTFEGRLRAALVSLSRSRPIRCSDGELDPSAGLLLWIALRDCVHRERPLSACRTGATGGRGPRPFTTGYVWPAKTAQW